MTTPSPETISYQDFDKALLVFKGDSDQAKLIIAREVTAVLFPRLTESPAVPIALSKVGLRVVQAICEDGNVPQADSNVLDDWQTKSRLFDILRIYACAPLHEDGELHIGDDFVITISHLALPTATLERFKDYDFFRRLKALGYTFVFKGDDDAGP